MADSVPSGWNAIRGSVKARSSVSSKKGSPVSFLSGSSQRSL
jgi:hypothetical protein